MVSVIISLMNWALIKGGGETYATKVALGLKEIGLKINMITGKPFLFDKISPPTKDIPVYYVPHIYLRYPSTRLTDKDNELLRCVGKALSATSSLTYAFSFYKHLRRLRDFDIINIHDSFATLRPALRIKERSKKKVVVTLHGPFYHPLLKKVDAVVAFGDSINVLKRAGLRPRIIPPGVDLSLYAHDNLSKKRSFYRNYYSNENFFLILFVGRLIPTKNVKSLIYAVKKVKKEKDYVKLLIVGGGPLKRNLQRLSSELGMNENIIFVGSVPQTDVVKYYSIADCFVLPSYYDNYPIVLFEAMAAGLPIVASYTGGIPQIVKNELNGLLVSPNYLDIASAIMRVIEDSELAGNLAKNARCKAETHLSWYDVSQEYKILYEKILER